MLCYKLCYKLRPRNLFWIMHIVWVQCRFIFCDVDRINDIIFHHFPAVQWFSVSSVFCDPVLFHELCFVLINFLCWFYRANTRNIAIIFYLTWLASRRFGSWQWWNSCIWSPVKRVNIKEAVKSKYICDHRVHYYSHLPINWNWHLNWNDRRHLSRVTTM